MRRWGELGGKNKKSCGMQDAGCKMRWWRLKREKSIE
jgi:hypothetical protein